MKGWSVRKAEKQIRIQSQQNERRIHEQYTGGAYDLTTGDFRVWVRGEVVGFAASLADANLRAHNCLGARPS